jgi:AAA domain, putative AbiEii toxin, Type IV TA system/AAA ATPase domain
LELKSVRIQNYRSIDDSGVVPIEDITCLVGKNESGKTAFLHALHLLNPLNPIKGKTAFDDVMDFPSRRFSAYRKVRDTRPADVITAVFALTDNEVEIIEQDLGPGVLASREVTVVKGYNGLRKYKSEFEIDRVVKHLTAGLEMPGAEREAVDAATTIVDLLDALKALQKPHASVTELIERIQTWREPSLGVYLVDHFFEAWLPRFFYFSDYSTMRGRVSLPDLKAKATSDLADESDKTFLSLLQTANASLNDFDVLDFESLTRELEGVANSITQDVFAFWRQSPGLRVTIQMSQGNPDDAPPLNRGPVLNLRIYNPKHAVTVPFDERSRGFVWFFSFYAYFSNIEQDPQRETILLLDEPGLSLHATAQHDVLAFIERKLAPKHQVIYTTHSPFLIDSRRLARVRTVQDTGENGTIITADASRTDQETVSPLRAALSHDLATALVTGRNCLLVESPADLLYLQILSQACEDADLPALDPQWVVTPVGGADKVSAFVSLQSTTGINVAVLMDADPPGEERIEAIARDGHVDVSRLIQFREFAAGKQAGIEDLLDPAFYCALVSGAYAPAIASGALKPTDLKSRQPRITQRVAQYFRDNGVADGRLNRYRVAAYLARQQGTLVPELNAATMRRAAKMFERINSGIG